MPKIDVECVQEEAAAAEEEQESIFSPLSRTHFLSEFNETCWACLSSAKKWYVLKILPKKIFGPPFWDFEKLMETP